MQCTQTHTHTTPVYILITKKSAAEAFYVDNLQEASCAPFSIHFPCSISAHTRNEENGVKIRLWHHQNYIEMCCCRQTMKINLTTSCINFSSSSEKLVSEF